MTGALVTDPLLIETALRSNIQRIFHTLTFIAPAHVIIIALYIIRGSYSSPLEELWRKCLIVANAYLLLLEIHTYFRVKKMLREKADLQELKRVQRFIICLVLGSGVIITLINHLVSTDITPLTLTCVIAGTYYMQPLKSIVVYMSTYILYSLGLFALNYPRMIITLNLANSLLSIVVGLLLAHINWRNFCFNVLQQHQIAEMAYQDPLTGLPNRRFLDDVIQQEQDGDSSYIIILDVDDFKLINDTYGHPSGDSILKQLADLLQVNIGSDEVLARLGGEEFVLLVKNTTLQESLQVAEKLRKIIAEHNFVLGNEKIKITASFGLAPLIVPESPANFYVTADRALYEAKANGKNQIRVAERSVSGI